MLSSLHFLPSQRSGHDDHILQSISCIECLGNMATLEADYTQPSLLKWQ